MLKKMKWHSLEFYPKTTFQISRIFEKQRKDYDDIGIKKEID